MITIPEPPHNEKQEFPPKVPSGISDGLQRIRDERGHQKFDHGYTTDHDQHHHVRELVDAANCYLYEVVYPSNVPASQKIGTGLASVEQRSGSSTPMPSTWPWEPEAWKPSDDRVHNLEKAGALYLAARDLMARAVRNVADHIDQELQQRLKDARVL